MKKRNESEVMMMDADKDMARQINFDEWLIISNPELQKWIY